MNYKLVREFCLDCEGEGCDACIHGYRYFWIGKKHWNKEVAKEIEELLRLQVGLPLQAKKK